MCGKAAPSFCRQANVAELATKLLSNMARRTPRRVCILPLNRGAYIGKEAISLIRLLSVNEIDDYEPLELAWRFSCGLCISNRGNEQAVPIYLTVFERLAAVLYG